MHGGGGDAQFDDMGILLIFQILDGHDILSVHNYEVADSVPQTLVLHLQLLDLSFQFVDLRSATSCVVQLRILLLKDGFEFVYVVQSVVPSLSESSDFSSKNLVAPMRDVSLCVSLVEGAFQTSGVLDDVGFLSFHSSDVKFESCNFRECVGVLSVQNLLLLGLGHDSLQFHASTEERVVGILNTGVLSLESRDPDSVVDVSLGE